MIPKLSEAEVKQNHIDCALQYFCIEMREEVTKLLQKYVKEAKSREAVDILSDALLDIRKMMEQKSNEYRTKDNAEVHRQGLIQGSFTGKACRERLPGS